jgi:predicted  nucleic acid-binding Zn-ribbon protein
VTGVREDVSVQGARAELERIARELDERSKSLWNTEIELSKIREVYDDEFAEYETEWYGRYKAGEDKWPGEETRHRVFRQEKLKGSEWVRRMLFLERKRDRLEDRIRTLGKEADAQRSVLSALKVEMEATA